MCGTQGGDPHPCAGPRGETPSVCGTQGGDPHPCAGPRRGDPHPCAGPRQGDPHPCAGPRQGDPHPCAGPRQGDPHLCAGPRSLEHRGWAWVTSEHGSWLPHGFRFHIRQNRLVRMSPRSTSLSSWARGVDLQCTTQHQLRDPRRGWAPLLDVEVLEFRLLLDEAFETFPLSQNKGAVPSVSPSARLASCTFDSCSHASDSDNLPPKGSWESGGSSEPNPCQLIPNASFV